MGGSVNRANSDGGTYQAANLNVAGHLNLNVTGDTVLEGSSIHAATSNITTGGDLILRTLQDYFESESFSAGLSITFCGPTPCGGSFNFAVSESESDRSFDGLASITTDGELVIDVDGLTELVGAAIGSQSGELTLTTTELIIEDLIGPCRGLFRLKSIHRIDFSSLSG